MHDIITGLLVGAFGEEPFKRIARTKYSVVAFFIFTLLLVQLLIGLFIMLISIPSLFGGYYSDKPISAFFVDFIDAIFFKSQPYALLFSAFLALLGTLSYLWHRRYSLNDSNPSALKKPCSPHES